MVDRSGRKLYLEGEGLDGVDGQNGKSESSPQIVEQNDALEFTSHRARQVTRKGSSTQAVQASAVGSATQSGLERIFSQVIATT